MKTLLMLHGALNSKMQFLPLLPLLENDFEVLTLNLPGHGGEPLKDFRFTIAGAAHEVASFIEERKLSNVDVFGYSMGGYIALWLARFRPELVGNIMTLGTKLNWTPDGASREAAFLNPDKMLEKVPAYADKLIAEHGEQEWRDLLLQTADMMKDLGTNCLKQIDFTAINERVLMLRGDADNMVSHEETFEASNLMVNGDMKTLKNTHHAFEKADRQMLANEIMNFFG
jgi:pimeloyl-ACP methyl ester carboxylesterase